MPFIVFEGIDGSGKSTQLNLLYEKLTELNYPAIKVKDPGSTKVSQEIRNILLHKQELIISSQTELLLFGAARAQLVHEIILPALFENKIVLCDRFSPSTYVYQWYAKELSEYQLFFINELDRYINGNSAPDLIFYLKVDLETQQSRLTKRDTKDRFESRSNKYYQRALEGYDKYFENFPKNVCVIDATMEMSKIHDKILQETLDLLERIRRA